MNNLNSNNRKISFVLEVSKTPEKYIHLPFPVSNRVGKLESRKVDFKTMASNLWQTLLIKVNRLKLAMSYGSWANNTNLIKILSEEILKDPLQPSVLKTDKTIKDILQLCNYLKSSGESSKEDIRKVKTLTTKIQNLLPDKIITFSPTPEINKIQIQTPSIAPNTIVNTESSRFDNQGASPSKGLDTDNFRITQETPVIIEEDPLKVKENPYSEKDSSNVKEFVTSPETSDKGVSVEELPMGQKHDEVSIEPKKVEVQKDVSIEPKTHSSSLKTKKVVHLRTSNSLSLFRVTLFLFGLAAVIAGGLNSYAPLFSQGRQNRNDSNNLFDVDPFAGEQRPSQPWVNLSSEEINSTRSEPSRGEEFDSTKGLTLTPHEELNSTTEATISPNPTLSEPSTSEEFDSTEVLTLPPHEELNSTPEATILPSPTLSEPLTVGTLSEKAQELFESTALTIQNEEIISSRLYSNYKNWGQAELLLQSMAKSLLQTEDYPAFEKIKKSLQNDLGFRFYELRYKLINTIFNGGQVLADPTKANIHYANLLELGKQIGGEGSALAQKCNEASSRMVLEAQGNPIRAFEDIPVLSNIHLHQPEDFYRFLAFMKTNQDQIKNQPPEFQKESYKKLAYMELRCAVEGVLSLRDLDKITYSE